MRIFAIVIGWVIGLILIVGLIATCVQDYRSATPRIVEVRIIDKRYTPGYYEQHCSTQYIESSDSKIPITTCHDEWIAPKWIAKYEDAGDLHTLDISSGIFDTLTIGQQKWMRYYVGGGYYHARYNEGFLLDKPLPENVAK